MRVIKSAVLSALVLTILVATTSKKPAARTDWKDVEAALGRAGSLQAGNVYKVAFPRSDLAVTVDGVAIRPALALGSWAAFRETDGQAMAMGDLVLLESEVNPVISALQSGGIEQTALHNHIMGESPSIMYLHFRGHGDAVNLARTLHNALALTKTPIAAPAAPAASPSSLDLPTAELDGILGYAGKANGGVDQFSVRRADKIVEAGMEIPPSMGMATTINFQPTGNGRAAITGDFVMTGSEVNRVIRALRSGGIEITALHSHMLEEKPRLFFMHFWANDDAVKLARTLRAALDTMNNKK